uniref:Uncharacterized protein n=1 Tax=Solanum tuberosum TaxID=4113 RepID=M1DKD6_SOLTU
MVQFHAGNINTVRRTSSTHVDTYHIRMRRELDALKGDGITRCEGLIEANVVRFDNLTARLEALEKVEGSSGALDTMRDAPASIPLQMPNIEPTSSVHPNIVVSVYDVDVDAKRVDDYLA